MNRKRYYLAHIISIIFIPLFIPVYLFALLLFGFPVLAGNIAQPATLLAEIALITVAIPFVLFFALYKLRIISSFTLNARRDRFIPQLFTLLAYVVMLGLLIRNGYSIYLRNIMLANVVLTFIVTAITLRWKISAHSSGIAGIMGAMTVLLFKSPPEHYAVWYAFGWCCFFAVSASRLYLRVHSPMQVFAGILLGGSIGTSAILLI
ncbi:MAG: phosphatase PAP2 family protein [Mucilaginibacter polytrichastri]|nr:phosphatase PAP2 family protein [Mucilaginibacter polytrichastri]